MLLPRLFALSDWTQVVTCPCKNFSVTSHYMCLSDHHHSRRAVCTPPPPPPPSARHRARLGHLYATRIARALCASPASPADRPLHATPAVCTPPPHPLYADPAVPLPARSIERAWPPLDAPRRRRAFHHPAHAPASARALALDAPRCTAPRTLMGAYAGPSQCPAPPLRLPPPRTRLQERARAPSRCPAPPPSLPSHARSCGRVRARSRRPAPPPPCTAPLLMPAPFVRRPRCPDSCMVCVGSVSTPTAAAAALRRMGLPCSARRRPAPPRARSIECAWARFRRPALLPPCDAPRRQPAPHAAGF
ncbi:hypothetical protein GGX14DRAFT_594656 [Mycena pura]|uniref:Uncharacterized protein n=1 Tax=Mycena pura TaxID=153505 RepID=A0AAD6YGA3_9AGAR|nr:hypothetical protein GGX14DRAFT_594656 [Mycena pura]